MIQNFTLEMPGKTSCLDLLENYVSEITKNLKLELIEIKRIELALDEACTNIIEHGYNFNDSKTITIKCSVDDSKITFILEDTGKSFDPTSVNVNLNIISKSHLEAGVPHKEGGLGIFLIKQIMDEVHYTTKGSKTNTQGNSSKNVLSLVKYLKYSK